MSSPSSKFPSARNCGLVEPGAGGQLCSRKSCRLISDERDRQDGAIVNACMLALGGLSWTPGPMPSLNNMVVARLFNHEAGEATGRHEGPRRPVGPRVASAAQPSRKESCRLGNLWRSQWHAVRASRRSSAVRTSSVRNAESAPASRPRRAASRPLTARRQRASALSLTVRIRSPFAEQY